MILVIIPSFLFAFQVISSLDRLIEDKWSFASYESVLS